MKDCEVPEENVLGSIGTGARVLMSGLDYERVVLSGGPLGIMQACMDVVVPYIHDRKQFGQAIGEFQLVQGKISRYVHQDECGQSLRLTLLPKPVTAVKPPVKTLLPRFYIQRELATQNGIGRHPVA